MMQLSGLPFMAVANIGVHLYHTNYRPGAPQGRRAWGHVAITCFAWLAGKMSYRDACINKIAMSGLDTHLVRELRKRKGLDVVYGDDYLPPNQDPTYQELPADPVDQWGSSFTSAVQDDNHPMSSRRSNEPSAFLDPDAPTTDNSVTYDSLRERNRRSFQEPVRRQL